VREYAPGRTEYSTHMWEVPNFCYKRLCNGIIIRNISYIQQIMSLILLVDDDVAALHLTESVLYKSGYDVAAVTSAHAALELIRTRRPDLAILDIMLPEMTGIELCRRLRSDPMTGKIGILFLTALEHSSDIALALDAGGDDYLIKSFDGVELLARVRALLRRIGGPLDPKANEISVGSLTLLVDRPVLYISGRVIELTSLEHRVMFYLMSHRGQPVPADQLLENVWHYPPGTGDPTAVRVHIANLRHKIEPVPEHPRYLLNVRGHGYLVSSAP
jgi:DNA-binding response OmpR family regulator